MLLVPGSLPADADLVDRDVLNLGCMAVDWDSKPSGALRGFDAIAIPPTARIILDIVIEHKNIRFDDLVEVTAPGDIGGLEDNTARHNGRAYRLSISWMT
jgi:hypothetical protein